MRIGRLVLKLFEAFSIERWNDLIRPFDLIEMDKAAEKMVIAYILGKYEENNGRYINWKWMIYASFFDLLKKIALCDIKAPVQALIKSEYPAEYIRLNEWVISQYKPLLQDDEIFSLFENYIGQVAGTVIIPAEDELTFHVYKAAHKYSTFRELQMIKPVNEYIRLQRVENELNEEIQRYLDLRGLQLMVTKQRPYEFLLKIEQLRFQCRWNQTPRIPHTSVLGHCYFVAVLTLLLELDSGMKPCERRMFNNFFSALFHDLPEAVTRDIISPVKQATDELPQIVKQIEDEIVNKELVPLMENFYSDELMYFTSDEFENRIIVDRKTEHVSFEDLCEKFNEDKYCPVDGKLVRLADHLSALVEADYSIKHGTTSSHLESGRRNIFLSYPEGTVINGIDANTLFRDCVGAAVNI